MAALLEQLKAITRIVMYLVIAFVLIKLWQDPHGSAQATVDFVKAVGRFFSTVVEKIGEFVNGLG